MDIICGNQRLPLMVPYVAPVVGHKQKSYKYGIKITIKSGYSNRQLTVLDTLITALSSSTNVCL